MTSPTILNPDHDNPVIRAIDKLFAPDPRYAWLDEFGRKLKRERQAREHFSKVLSDKREPVGDRNRKIARILARDGDECCYCGKPLGDDMTLEHRIALSNGGTDDLDNLKLAHALCNREVGNLPPDMKDELAKRQLIERSETLG
jgi:5-methylcytosine-specific restriction endonuclease McrA